MNILRVTYFVLYLATVNSLSAQINPNLVQNGSFENFTNCPTMVSQFMITSTTSNVPFWSNPLLQTTPDLYNACDNSNIVGVPINTQGTQLAFDQNGYAGIITYWADEPSNWDEYIQTGPIFLENGITYEIRFQAALSPNSLFSTDNLGIYVAPSLPTQTPGNRWLTVSGSSYLVNSNYLSTPGQWVQQNFEFTPTTSGNYYLTIGNFNNSNGTPTSIPTGNDGFAYYYIDDVVVKEKAGCCPDNLTIDNQTLSGAHIFGANNSITVGPNVDVSGTADITFVAGNTVTFEPPFNGGPGTNAIIGECPGELQIKSTDPIPNVITPNGDAINDHVCVAIYGGTSGSVEVFGRFGNLVYASSGTIYTLPVCIWDGSCNQGFPNCIGTNLSDGEYIVLLTVMGCDRPNGEFQQLVTLFDSNLRLANHEDNPEEVQWSVANTSRDLPTQEFGLSVYPNPTTTAFNLTIPEDVISSEYWIEIYDGLGKRVYFLAPNTTFGLTQIEITGLSSGAYSIYVRNLSKQYLTHVIIKE